MFQGYIDQDRATPVEASAIPDALFERGLYWASGRSGVATALGVSHDRSSPSPRDRPAGKRIRSADGPPSRR